MARPSKYETHVELRLSEVADWVRNGATESEIAKKLGISERSFYEYKKEFTQFSQVLKNTRACVDGQVENALLKKALAGDTTAMIFWLKNRRPKAWRDKPDAEGDDEENVTEVSVTYEDASEGAPDETTS